MLKKLIFWSLIILLDLGIIVLAGELYARIKHGDVLDFKSSEAEYRIADFDLHHSLIPGAKGHSIRREWDVEYDINSLGLRDREYLLRKRPETFRILVMGDSFTEGYGVAAEDTFVKVFEGKINGASGEIDYQVMNCGIASYSPLLEYIFLSKKALKLRPDMVVLFYDFGDLNDDQEYEITTFFDETGRPLKSVPYKRVRAYSFNPFERFLIRHSRFYLYLENRVNKALFKKRMMGVVNKYDKTVESDRYIAFREGEEEKVSQLWKRNEKYLQMIYELLKENEVEFVLVSYPYALEVSGEEWSEGRALDGLEVGRVYDQPVVIEYLEKFAKERGIPFINLYEDFRESNSGPLYYDFDGHFTEKGHKLAADSLYKRMTNRGLIDI